MTQASERAQILVTGIGGQGVLFATRILAESALRQGRAVIGSETHGMSQRGGSVISHLKIGGFASPLVRPANADALVALDPHEAYRALRFVRPAAGARPGGVLFANAPEGFPQREVRAALVEAGVGLGVVDASALASQLGSPVVVNLITLGFAAADPRFPFDLAALEQTVAAISPPRFAELNLRALGEGHRLGRACGAPAAL